MKEFLPNPYANAEQSRDLREIATSFDPVFRAENDLVQLNFSWELSDTLTFFLSQPTPRMTTTLPKTTTGMFQMRFLVTLLNLGWTQALRRMEFIPIHS